MARAGYGRGGGIRRSGQRRKTGPGGISGQDSCDIPMSPERGVQHVARLPQSRRRAVRGSDREVGIRRGPSRNWRQAGRSWVRPRRPQPRRPTGRRRISWRRRVPAALISQPTRRDDLERGRERCLRRCARTHVHVVLHGPGTTISSRICSSLNDSLLPARPVKVLRARRSIAAVRRAGLAVFVFHGAHGRRNGRSEWGR